MINNAIALMKARIGQKLWPYDRFPQYEQYAAECAIGAPQERQRRRAMHSL
jgi:hypothetical protein